MTSHELAKKLLEMPDVDTVVPHYESTPNSYQNIKELKIVYAPEVFVEEGKDDRTILLVGGFHLDTATF